ncbi:hypothetical protein RFI_26282 [Reticulomyxa filosa]|uniref:Uncharacterized protein n=1 Tax=Reticulomyxa filosa TaxID=46433 RepID=X6MAQ3_RETFI|nr:hypothetical protein RFI_26282 [Reticulomyxa filosa]|eukprot:ETO11093.1 hypothetical protein RFI_26282 [Reticulomyxa filosa]
MAESGTPSEMKEDSLPPSSSRSKHLTTDSLSTPLQKSRRNSSVHLEIRKASLMEQESLLDKVLQGDSIPDNDNDPMSASNELARQKRLQIERKKKKIIQYIYYFFGTLKKKKKELISIQWEIIDTEDNGDVDVNEWKRGMMGLKVSLTEDQIIKLFGLLDEDKVGFVDRQTYQSFVTGTFNANHLTDLQQPLLRLARRLHRQLKQKEEEQKAKSKTASKAESNSATATKHSAAKSRDANNNNDSNNNNNNNNDEDDHHSDNDNNNANDTDAVRHKDTGSVVKEMEAELKKQASALKLRLMEEKQYLEEIEEMANTKEDFLNSVEFSFDVHTYAYAFVFNNNNMYILLLLLYHWLLLLLLL